MGWHAATLTIIGIVMTLRARFVRVAWPWMLRHGMGLSELPDEWPPQATYMVARFRAAFLLRLYPASDDHAGD